MWEYCNLSARRYNVIKGYLHVNSGAALMRSRKRGSGERPGRRRCRAGPSRAGSQQRREAQRLIDGLPIGGVKCLPDWYRWRGPIHCPCGESYRDHGGHSYLVSGLDIVSEDIIESIYMGSSIDRLSIEVWTVIGTISVSSACSETSSCRRRRCSNLVSHGSKGTFAVTVARCRSNLSS